MTINVVSLTKVGYRLQNLISYKLAIHTRLWSVSAIILSLFDIKMSCIIRCFNNSLLWDSLEHVGHGGSTSMTE